MNTFEIGKDENLQKGLRFLMSCGILHMLE